MGAGGSVLRPARSAEPATPRLECELAVSPPMSPGDGDEDLSLVCANASSANPKPKLGFIFALVSSLLADHELRAAVVLVNGLASSSLGSAETTGTQSAFKNHVAQILDTHASAVSKPLSVSINRRICDDTNDEGGSSSWQRATSGGIELASSPPPTPPRKGNYTTGLLDSNGEPNLHLGDVLGLLSIPLDANELRAASLLVEGLVASMFGEAELSCTHSALKDQIVQVLDTNRSALSNVVFAFINRYIDADANIADQESGSAAPSPNDSDTPSVTGPGLSPSFTISLISSHSSEALEQRTSEDFAVGHVTLTRAWFHHENIDVSGSEHSLHRK